MAGSQPELAPAVLSEKAPVPDIAPHHLNRPVPGLVHDRPFRCPRNRRARGMPGPQPMPGIVHGIQPSPLSQLLHHPRNIDILRAGKRRSPDGAEVKGEIDTVGARMPEPKSFVVASTQAPASSEVAPGS